MSKIKTYFIGGILFYIGSAFVAMLGMIDAHMKYEDSNGRSGGIEDEGLIFPILIFTTLLYYGIFLVFDYLVCRRLGYLQERSSFLLMASTLGVITSLLFASEIDLFSLLFDRNQFPTILLSTGVIELIFMTAAVSIIKILHAPV